MPGLTVPAPRRRPADRAGLIAEAARDALLAELEAHPKPGLVSRFDPGSHDDMDAATFESAIAAIAPFFADLARAGAAGAEMPELRRIGLGAEAAMLAATGGVNTHRGAIFGLGLLSAAAGAHHGGRLGSEVRRRWRTGILAGPGPADHPGAAARRRYGAGGAPAEAAAGFPTLYLVGLPTLRRARIRGTGDPAVETCMALIAAGGDTNLLHRGGREGAAFARTAAADFLAEGGTAQPGWRGAALDLHRAFVRRRLSPGGAADLLAMTLFVAAIEAEPRP